MTSSAHIFIAHVIHRYPASNRNYDVVLCVYVIYVYITFCIVFQLMLHIKNKGYAVIYRFFKFVQSIFVDDIFSGIGEK